MKGKIKLIKNWIIGLFLVLLALSVLSQSIVSAIAFLGIGILILPPANKYLLKINVGTKILIGLGLLLIAGSAMPKTSSENNIVKNDEKEIIISPTPTSKTEITENKYLVTKVIDGDTLIIKIDDEEKPVRLIGIDAPESNENGSKEATEKLTNLVENKEVSLEPDESQEDKDIYDRLLRYIFIDGSLINQKMIEDGLAKEYTYKTAYKYQTEFKEAQAQSKENKIGIWSQDFYPTTIPTKKVVKETSTQTNSSFVCNCAKTCTEISSCEEAYYQLNNCGCSKRDADDDGVPCESLCR